MVALDDVHEDALELSHRGAKRAAALVRAASRLRREPCPASDLFLGIECGHSDATSGLAANPTAGAAADRLIDAGGTAVFGETVEWLGAERQLARRARTSAVAQAIVAAVERREAAVAATGFDLTGNNPGAENIRGGLSTIEEKSLGAVAKGGTRPIAGVLAIAEEPRAGGLYLMDAPAFSPESLTGFAASGANVMLFTTGAGNSFCNALAPTIKVSGRPDTVSRLPHQIDFDAGGALAGRREPRELGAALFELVLAVASGERTWGEILAKATRPSRASAARCTGRTEMSNVGFIGLGTMGGPMARNVLKRGHRLTVHDVNPRAVAALVEAGAAAAPTPKAVAEAAEIVITMLPDAPDVERVARGRTASSPACGPARCCSR